MESLLFIQCNHFYLFNAVSFIYSIHFFYLFDAIFFIDLMQSFLFLSMQSLCKLNLIIFHLCSGICVTYLMQCFLLMQCNLLLRGCL